ncbi:P-type conjugative transfer protein TrbL, partial [Nitrosomonas sp.]|uniref:P-type conjugative transfer protein TrbL n=1 Tax=Nitrosomonas sp. TaxID=42353 RepID=UPI001E078814
FWLLTNAVSGQNIAGTIIDSMQQLGGTAAGLPGGANHASIVDTGILIWHQAMNNMNILDPIDSLVGLVLSLGILIILAVIAVNMLLLLIASWVLLYAGIFLLGFGGARWTTDIAINYFKTVLGVGIQLFVMLLIIGIGSDLLTSFYSKMGKNVLNYEELAVMLVFTIALWVLISKLPPLISGIVTGSSIGSTAGIGSYSAGGLVAAAGTTAAITAYGLSALRRNSPIKGIEPLMNAVKAGQNAENSSNYISRGGR